MKGKREKMLREFSEKHQSLIDVLITTVDKIAEKVKNNETIPQNEKLDFLIGVMLGTTIAVWGGTKHYTELVGIVSGDRFAERDNERQGTEYLRCGGA